MSPRAINWNQVTFAIVTIIAIAFFITTVWVFTDIWLPYQASRRTTENIKEYIQKHQLYKLDPSLIKE